MKEQGLGINQQHGISAFKLNGSTMRVKTSLEEIDISRDYLKAMRHLVLLHV